MTEPTIVYDWNELPVVLTTKIVAVILDCSQSHICQLCKDGELPAVRIGKGKWAIPKDKFITLIEGGD